MQEVWVICRIAATVLHFELFTGFVEGKAIFSDVIVFTFSEDDKSIQAMIYTSRKRAEKEMAEIYALKEKNELYVAPLSTVIAAARAWR